MFPFAESKIMKVYQLTIILSVNIFTVHCGPLMQGTIDGSWGENMVDCSPGGRCWEWLQHNQDLAANTKPDFYGNTPRLQTRQEQDSAIVQLPVAGLPPTNRLAKKDVFMSRGWGAGGMPFSVLYLNPHNSRSNSNAAANANEIGLAKALPLEGSGPHPPPRHSNSPRVAPRNGASGQPRRKYSIIPQLFVSYGWGPLGK